MLEEETSPHESNPATARSLPEREDLFQEYQQWSRRLTGLLDAVANISENLDVLEVSWSTVREMSTLLECEACVLSLWDQNDSCLRSQAVFKTGEWQLPESWHEPRSPSEHPLFHTIQVMEHGEQMNREQENIYQPELEFLQTTGIRSMLALPLIAGEHNLIGLIEVIEGKKSRRFLGDEIAIGELLATHAAIAIENARYYQDAERWAGELETVRQATLRLTASLDLQELLDAILEHTLEVMPGLANGHIYLYEDEELRFKASIWSDGHKGGEFSKPRPDGLTYRAARTGKAILVEDMETDPLFEDSPSSWTGSIVSIPLRYGQQILGVMNIAHPQKNAFNEHHLRILNLLGDQAAISILNAHLHDMVTRQARTDPLTRLNNRRALDERLQDEVRRSQRYERVFSLAMIDLNNFKRVNDTFGHPVGDQVLAQIAGCMTENMRNTDFLARFGGDEFSVILPETDYDEAYSLVRRLQTAVEGLQIAEDPAKTWQLQLTFGIATYPADGGSAEDLLGSADQALYQAKGDGAQPS